MTSTQLCLQLGISPKTLYLWESTGKIPKSKRDRRGWRVYGPEQVKVIKKFARGPGNAVSDSLRYETRTAAGLSARNQIRGKVISIRAEGLLAKSSCAWRTARKWFRLLPQTQSKGWALKKETRPLPLLSPQTSCCLNSAPISGKTKPLLHRD